MDSNFTMDLRDAVSLIKQVEERARQSGAQESTLLEALKVVQLRKLETQLEKANEKLRDIEQRNEEK